MKSNRQATRDSRASTLTRCSLWSSCGLCLLAAFAQCSPSTPTNGVDGGSEDAESDNLVGDEAASNDETNTNLDSSVESSITDGNGGDGYDVFTLPYRRVFITSQRYAGNFGGLTGGDQICNSTATAAGLGGTWTAWLSTTTTSAASRLEHATVPYQLLNGTVLAANWTELTSGSLRHPIDRDEHDSVVVPSGPPYTPPLTGTAWTATEVDGSNFSDPSFSCNDWTYSIDGGANVYGGIAGINPYGEDGGATGQVWTHSGDYDCTTLYPASLYCIEQP